MDQDNLKFVTDDGDFCFQVYGDCCSVSYFNDFYGVRNLLENGAILEVKGVKLTDEEEKRFTARLDAKKEYYDQLQFYGYRFTTNHPEFGLVSSVFSFRNDSNGYYGGSLGSVSQIKEGVPEIFNDVIET